MVSSKGCCYNRLGDQCIRRSLQHPAMFTCYATAINSQYFFKVDQCQPHEEFWTAHQSSKVVSWVRTKPSLAGIKIPFGGTRFGFVQVSMIKGILLLLQTSTQNQILFIRRKFDFLLTQGWFLTRLTTWDDWQGLQKSSWGQHWSTFKNIGC